MESEIKDSRRDAEAQSIGNAAKLREALVGLIDGICFHCDMSEDCKGAPCEKMQKAKAALAAPPRNCDRYATFNDAITALADKRGWHDGKWNSERYCILAQWLFGPANEKGATDESK